MTNIRNGGRRIGFVGIGRMGKPMATNIISAGFPLMVYDINKNSLREMEQLGAIVAQDASQLGEHNDVVIAMLLNYEQIKEVVLTPQGVLNNMKRDSSLIIMSSLAPIQINEIDNIAKDKGVAVLDAPVSGGVSGAKAGTLSIMVGGDTEIFSNNRALFEAMGKNVKHVGELGHGCAFKMINQIMVEVNFAATAEAMAMAKMLGLDLEEVFQMVSKSVGNSEVFKRRAPKIINRDFNPEGSVDIAVEDTKDILKTAMALGIPLPMVTAAYHGFHMAKSLGYGAEDEASIIKIYESLS